MKYMKSKTSKKIFGSCEDIDSDDENNSDVMCSVEDNLNSGYEIDDSFMLNKFKEYKTNYYSDKLEITDKDITPEFLKNQAEEYIKAIQWNLHYYYDGVCSWSWFYPQHYAPYISDIKDFSDLSMKFDLGIPFKQFEQLLSVLPASSKELLPKPYQSLMTDKKSPIIDYYPKDFVIDKNGKLNDWEAIVRIPFIDEKKLFDAMKPINKKLNEDEKKRNDHGPFYIYSYSHNKLSSSPYEAPEGFPTVVKNQTVFEKRDYDFFYLPKDQIVKGLLPGAIAAKFCLGFPTLNYVKFTTRVEKSFIKVHDQKSLYENMILNIKPIPDNEIDIEALASKYLGKSCYVFWPFCKEALVTKLSTISMSIELSPQGTMIRKPVESVILSKWLTDAKSIEYLYHNKYGVSLNYQINCLVYVKHKKGFRLNPQTNKLATFSDEWNSTINVYPLQLVVWNLPDTSARLKKPIPIVDLFKPKDICYLLGFNFYGSQAVVEDVMSNGLVKIQVQKCQEPCFKGLFNFRNNMYKTYMSANVITAKLSITPHLFSKICGSILVKRTPNQIDINERPEIVDIGFNIRLVKLKMWTPEFVVYSDGEWYYSEKLYHYVIQYIRFCPSVFKHIVENIHEKHILEEECFLNSDKNLDEVLWFLKGIGKEQWVHEYGPKTLLTEQVIHKLESVLSHYNPTYSNRVIIQVKPEILFKYDMLSDNIAPDPNADFQIFDRVINISLSNAVPYGFKGTVIGKKVLGSLADDETSLSFTSFSDSKPKSSVEDISNLVVDVLFDNDFVGAVSINGSAERALKIKASCLINISYGNRHLRNVWSKNGSIPVAQTSNTSKSTSIFNEFTNNNDKLNWTSNKSLNNLAQEQYSTDALNVQNPPAVPTKVLLNQVKQNLQNVSEELNINDGVNKEKVQAVNISASENLKKLLKISRNSDESSRFEDAKISEKLDELSKMESNVAKRNNFRQNETNEDKETVEDCNIVNSVLNTIMNANTLKVKNDAELPNLENLQIKSLTDLESSFKSHKKEEENTNNLNSDSDKNLIDTGDLHKCSNVIKNSETKPVVQECNTSQNIKAANTVSKKKRRIVANIFDKK